MSGVENLKGASHDLTRVQRDLNHAYSLLLSATKGNAALANELLFEPVTKLNSKSPSELIRAGNTEFAIKFMFERIQEMRDKVTGRVAPKPAA